MVQRRRMMRLWARDALVHRALLALMVTLIGLPGQTRAQSLTPRDTATVVALVYERVSARWGKSIDIAEPVWIPDSMHNGTLIGDETRLALEEHVPTIRRVPSASSALICPDDEKQRLLRHCVILGFGRVLSFRFEEQQELGEVLVTVTVWLMASKDHAYLFGGKCRVRRQDDGEWVITEVLDLRIS